jgi:hypothetical protein
MNCPKCKRKMSFKKGIPFNEHRIDGFTCTCGEVFFDPEQAERVLLLNKLKKQKITSTLGRIKSNLILRLPKDVENALGFEQGEEVELSVVDQELRVRSI